MYSCLRLLFFITLIFGSQTTLVFADRIKDLTSLAGIRSNQLVGYGVVVGLAGSGDGNTGITLQSMQSLVSRFGITSDLDGFNGDNAAAVMITADLPPFTKPGQSIDVTVSTVGGATSLKGGTLLMSPLLGADGETYAIAQGNVVVGGLGVEGGDNSSLTVNIPTVGRIPRGASVERLVPTEFLSTDFVKLYINCPKELLLNRIKLRVVEMLPYGIKEVKKMRKIKVPKSYSSTKIIGVNEIKYFLDKKLNSDQTIELMVIKTRQYAKRQATWARGQMKNWKRVSALDTKFSLKKLFN